MRLGWMVLLSSVACTPGIENAGELVRWSAEHAPTPPPPGDLALTADPLLAGTTATLTVTGADPFEDVYLARSTNGTGGGPCPPPLGGACLDLETPVRLHDVIATDATGTGTTVFPVPNRPGNQVCFQAMAIRGPGGVDSEIAPAWCDTVVPEVPVIEQRIVSYFTEWGVYARDYYVADIPAAQLTNVHYAFAMIMGDDYGLVGTATPCLPPPEYVPGSYTIGICDPWASVQNTAFPRMIGDIPTWEDQLANEAGSLQQLQQLKLAHPHLQTSISVGGWSLSGDFGTMAADPALTAAFVESVVAFVDRYGFDGVDINWEFPVLGGEEDTPGATEDAANFTALLSALRAGLGPDRLLSVAVGANPDAIDALDFPAFVDDVDYVSILSYDFHGAWDSGLPTAHQAALYDHGDPVSPELNVSSAVENLLAAGVPASKLVPGVPFYGRSMAGVEPSANGYGALFTGGAGPGTWEPGIVDYDDIAANYETNPAYTKYFDNVAKAPWLYDPVGGVFVTYDDPCAVAHKANYILANDLGGAMSWELSADGGALLQVLYHALTGVDAGLPCAP